MTIILISSLHQDGREALAESLARKTNWPILSREEAQEKARDQGIKVGRLEISVMKQQRGNERLAREKNLYLALITATICERARHGNLIYSGRAGHLMLPGVTHRLRVGLTAPRDVRIKRTAAELSLSADKAETYLQQLDVDVQRWVRWVHGVEGRSPDFFDAFFNLENMALANASSVICSMAELPDFQATPASLRTLEDLYLSAKAQIRLAQSEKTADADLQVTSQNGLITVTYPPHQEHVSGHITRVLSDLEGCRGVRCTMAETNILWIGEKFDSASDNFQQIIQLSQRWGAAVELLRPIDTDLERQDSLIPSAIDPQAVKRLPLGRNDSNGGVEDDVPEPVRDDGGLGRTEEALVNLGRYGGQHTAYGGYGKMLEAVQGAGSYALVVIGDIFLSKGHSIRTRRTRELAMSIRDRLKAPVITADELKSRFLFGTRQAMILLGFLAIIILIYSSVFEYQEAVLDFLSGPIHTNHKWLSPIVVVLFVPFIAYVYGKVTELALKIINID
jgi:cytidylate kinase